VRAVCPFCIPDRRFLNRPQFFGIPLKGMPSFLFSIGGCGKKDHAASAAIVLSGHTGRVIRGPKRSPRSLARFVTPNLFSLLQ
jgi:hypothetical protein